MGGRGGAGGGLAGRIQEVLAENRIRRAYSDLHRGDIEWVALADLRARLGLMSHEEQDQTLRGLLQKGQIRLIPEENQKTITAADRRAGIKVSGEEKHLISIHDPSLRPLPKK